MWVDCNKRSMTTNPNKIWTSQRKSKFTFALSLLGPSLAIINNVMYLNISCLIGEKIEIYWIFTLCKILTPFVSIILTSLENSKCCLKLFKKNCTMWRARFWFYSPYVRIIFALQDWYNEPYNELPWSGGAHLLEICFVTLDLIPWNTTTLFTWNVFNFLPINFLDQLASFIRLVKHLGQVVNTWSNHHAINGKENWYV